jgi:two-component system, OmpR family, alkaline phosphatase synthesis response regulator PhoP
VRLLVVDDNPLNLELFEAALTDAGHHVEVATSGDAGFARALAESFDVVLLDVQLPGRSGIEICRELRRAGRDGPILAVSANALPDQVALGMAAGFDQYLTKPLAPHVLRAAVAAYLPPPSSRPATQPAETPPDVRVAPRR